MVGSLATRQHSFFEKRVTVGEETVVALSKTMQETMEYCEGALQRILTIVG